MNGIVRKRKKLEEVREIKKEVVYGTVIYSATGKLDDCRQRSA